MTGNPLAPSQERGAFSVDNGVAFAGYARRLPFPTQVIPHQSPDLGCEN
jgi:hypothetical protein